MIDGLFYVFNIKNTQEDYASCLHFMELLEGLCPDKNIMQQFDEVRSIVKAMSISGAALPDNVPAKRYFEEPIVYLDHTGRKRSSQPLIESAKKLKVDRVQSNILKYVGKNIYHIRIHFDRTDDGMIKDLMNLRYLALLLQRMEVLIDDKFPANSRISVFAIPASGDSFPFHTQEKDIDVKTYKTVSSYLRLISKKYIGITFGVTTRNDRTVVQSLNFKNTSRFVSDFPLTPIEKDTYEKLFDQPVTQTEFNTVLRLKKGRRFGAAASSQPRTAFRDYLMEASAGALKHTYSDIIYDNSKEQLEYMIGKTLFPEVDRGEKLSLLTFALFCFTLCSIDLCDCQGIPHEVLSTKMEACKRRAIDLTEGIRQIAQNALQYSPNKSGVLSFSVQRENLEHPIIRLALCDYNDRISLAETFAQTLERERALGWIRRTADGITGYDGLIEHRKEIRLKNFFNEYGKNFELECAWDQFRRSDIFAHVGLLLFAATVRRCEGTFCAINSRNWILDADNLYYRNYGDNRKDSTQQLYMKVIPGTQFLIEIPASLQSQKIYDEPILGLAQLNHIHEGYYEFAQYLPVDTKHCTFLSLHENLQQIYEAEEKKEAMRNWRNIWLISAEKAKTDADKSCDKIVFYWDMENQIHALPDVADESEVFWKGFVSALDELEEKGFRYIAVTNLSKTQITVFRSLCQVYMLKAFPKTMQIYLSQKMENTHDIERQANNKVVAFHLTGDTYAQAIQNAYCLSVERGTHSFTNYELENVHAMWNNTIRTVEPLKLNSDISICPFDALLPYEKDSPETLFDHQVSLMAENPIDQSPFGNKIADTHMQLGSKVHIQSFYEMAYLFYRTSIANRIAFELLRELQKKPAVDLLKDTFLFYGYASYSKALLTSIREILKFYRTISSKPDNMQRIDLIPDRTAGSNLAIATFQHNLQSESKLPQMQISGQDSAENKVSGVEKSQLYFDFPSSTKEGVSAETDFFGSGVKLIQIVPISSTLTTFEKMYARILRGLKAKISDSEISRMHLYANFTAFWVTDATEDIRAGKLSGIEKKYIEETGAMDIPKERRIITKLNGMRENPSVHYLMLASAVWEAPLQCKKCYPENVIMEIPLVSVDQTSTVPTQQLRAKSKVTGDIAGQKENNIRLLTLKDCVWKGHFLREKNHYNYYIDTQKFFAIARDNVANWLSGLADDMQTTELTPLNIIFSPEHATNIGFAQYVNNYYFKGNAEIVCLNEDKEFRSNFCCEHMALRQAIRQIFSLYGEMEINQSQNVPVKFHFVDDTIISGATFFKANSFLRSLLPDRIRRIYPTNLIDQCFVLVDRLSNASKQNYVKDVDKDFHSFVHLDISNARTQGDSCTGCKHVQNSVHLFKRSATRLHATYWLEQINNNAICSYDDVVSHDRMIGKYHDWKGSDYKVLLSHIAQNVIFNENDYFAPGAIYDSILLIMSKLLGMQELQLTEMQFAYEELIQAITANIEPVQAVFDLLNLISRPFFSYDFKCRLQVQTMLLIFSECLIHGNQNTEKYLNAVAKNEDSAEFGKEFIFKNARISYTIAICKKIEQLLSSFDRKVDFLDRCIFSSLAEMQSTYLLRRRTFMGVYHFVRNATESNYCQIGDFLKHYACYIQFLLDSNTDETRSLWLEYLLTTGEEYPRPAKWENRPPLKPLYETIKEQQENNFTEVGANALVDELYSYFLDEVFMQNISTIYDGIENKETNPAYGDSYFMEYWKDFRWVDGIASELLDSERSLFKAIRKYAEKSDGTMTVKRKYDDILEKLQKVAEEKYGFSNVKIALLTCSEKEGQDSVGDGVNIRQLDFVANGKRIPRSDSWTRHRIKKNLVVALEQGNKKSTLLKYGYQLHANEQSIMANEDPYFFVFFDNPEEPIAPSVTASVGTSVEREIKKIVKVFLYFSAKSDNKKQDAESFALRLFLRDILVYRHHIMKILENDFAGDIFAKYAHTSSERSILAHEKVNSHNTSSDDRASLDVLALPRTTAQYEILDSAQVAKWLLLRNYTNGQIAKLFNRSFGSQEEDGLFDRGDSNLQAPPLYIGSDYALEGSSGPDKPLMYFCHLGILDDARFSLLEQAVSIIYDENLENAEFICNAEGEFYNAEYMKCVFIDSLFSAMKYYSDHENFLHRLDHCLKKMHLFRHQSNLQNSPSYNVEICTVKLSREVGNEYDYLVITNDVDYTAHNLYDLGARNQQIEAHLSSPTDFFDGHMSLLAIKEYIEGIHGERSEKKSKPRFEYQEETYNEKKKVKFISKLPILKKEEQ